MKEWKNYSFNWRNKSFQFPLSSLSSKYWAHQEFSKNSPTKWKTKLTKKAREKCSRRKLSLDSYISSCFLLPENQEKAVFELPKCCCNIPSNVPKKVWKWCKWKVLGPEPWLVCDLIGWTGQFNSGFKTLPISALRQCFKNQTGLTGWITN